jgi:hypothetical protein
MARGIRVNAEALRSLEFGDITGSFVAVGEKLLHPAHMYAIQNQTDVDIFWSWNGDENQGFLPAHGGHIILDITTNKRWEQGMYLEQGLTTYVKAVPGQPAPTLGAVYVTSFYGQIL